MCLFIIYEIDCQYDIQMSLKKIPLSGGSYPHIGIPMLPNSRGSFGDEMETGRQWVFEKRTAIVHLCID